jgi:hypothetical protein
VVVPDVVKRLPLEHKRCDEVIEAHELGCIQVDTATGQGCAGGRYPLCPTSIVDEPLLRAGGQLLAAIAHIGPRSGHLADSLDIGRTAIHTYDEGAVYTEPFAFWGLANPSDLTTAILCLGTAVTCELGVLDGRAVAPVALDLPRYARRMLPQRLGNQSQRRLLVDHFL